MKFIKRQYNEACLFINGPYQLMIGVACLQKYLPNIKKVNVITYDMTWQKKLLETTNEFIETLNLINITPKWEFKKASSSTGRTNLIRAIINHILFYVYTKKNCPEYVFLPKLYGSPERSIILASINKKIFVYDDGYGIYIDPSVNQNQIDTLIYKTLQKCKKNFFSNIGIYARAPKLIDFENFFNIQISYKAYTTEFFEVLSRIACKFNDRVISNFPEINEKTSIIFVALPRISISNINTVVNELLILIEIITKEFENILFILKPHPRDLLEDLERLIETPHDFKKWRFLQEELWSFPIEVLALIIRPKIILSGNSTIGINSDLFPNTEVLIYDFLGFNIPNYEKYAKRIMIKSGTYAGKDYKEAIKSIRKLLT